MSRRLTNVVEFTSSALKQSGTIMKSLFTKSSIFKSRSTISKMSDKIGAKTNLHRPTTISESSPLKRVISAAISPRHSGQNMASPSPSPQTSPSSASRTLISSGGSQEGYHVGESSGSDEDEVEDVGHGDGKAVARVKELWGKLGRKSREGSAEHVSLLP
jgi:hypothetical protein